MKKIYLALLCSLLIVAADLHSQIIWNGPVITFSSPGAGAAPDVINNNVSLSRAATQGIYNSAAEAAYVHNVSPVGTEWAYGTLSNYSTLSYAPWEVWNAAKPLTSLNRSAVLHLIADNIYIGIKFLTWETGQGGDGGFSYERTTASPLPVILKSFRGVLKGDQVMLYWTTSTEINNRYFEIEHSTNGESFTPIGRVNGKGNSTIEHSYTFVHKNTQLGKNFYRLAQHDLEGAIKYSQVVLVSSKSSEQILVSPNPATGFITLTGSFLLQGSKYAIKSTNGQVLKQGVLNGQQVDIAQLASGQYWINVQTSTGEFVRKAFIKQ